MPVSWQSTGKGGLVRITSRWTRYSMVGIVLMGLFFSAAVRGVRAQAIPNYKVDASWPKQLPNNWIVGQIGGMAVDKDDHIWVLHRPRSLTPDEAAAAQTPPTAECCLPAPSV